VRFFADIPNATLELRTKSTQVRGLLQADATANTVVAFSLAPHSMAEKVEENAPGLAKRLDALQRCQAHGWSIGLRFDPLLYVSNYQAIYTAFFKQVFAQIDITRLHSVSLGVFRLPAPYFKKMHKLYPEVPLFAGPLQQTKGMMTYASDIEAELLQFCSEQLLRYIPESVFFPCRL
jgi:spore photoproduct lyase